MSGSGAQDGVHCPGLGDSRHEVEVEDDTVLVGEVGSQTIAVFEGDLTEETCNFFHGSLTTRLKI